MRIFFARELRVSVSPSATRLTVPGAQMRHGSLLSLSKYFHRPQYFNPLTYEVLVEGRRADVLLVLNCVGDP